VGARGFDRCEIDVGLNRSGKIPFQKRNVDVFPGHARLEKAVMGMVHLLVVVVDHWDSLTIRFETILIRRYPGNQARILRKHLTKIDFRE
jgi:hypothetical protein